MSPEEQVAFFNTWQQDKIQRVLRTELQADETTSRLPTTARIVVSLLQMLHATMFPNHGPDGEIKPENPRSRVYGGLVRIAADLTASLPADYKALRVADNGDLSALVELLRAALV
jgi:hypothetical protein